MTFELVTNASAKPFPAASDISVRFLFHNGTASNESEPMPYPLFGQQKTVIPWSDFASGMSKFAIGDQADWCRACGNTTGVCAAYSASGSGPSSGSSNAGAGSASGGGMSNAVAGVIGAMVTLAVILAVEGLIILVGGLRLVSRKRVGRTGSGESHMVKT